MQESKKSCQACVLHTHVPGITINDEGICSMCESYRQFKQHEPRVKKYLLEEMENLFKKAKKERRAYDVIVLFSGGKDSTILLKMAKEQYHLRPLAFSVIHPLVNQTASRNMEIVAGKLNVDLIKVFPDENVYKRVIKHGIEKGPQYGLGEFFGCDVCSFFHSWLPIQYAMKMGIPVILEGSDSSQAGEMTYWQAERVKEDAKKGKKPFGRVHDLFIDALGEEYRGSIYDYDEEAVINGHYPTFISPFSFTEYDYRKNFEEIESMGLESKEFRSIYTNCSATPFFSYVSLKRFGCVSYIKHYANEVRRGYPNLMQRSLKDTDTADVLNKEMVENLMKEYKNVVIYVVENKLTEETITDGQREKLIAMAPNYLSLFGEDVCNVFLNDVLRISRYADYFNVDLNRIGA
jgi:hypothetical protein